MKLQYFILTICLSFNSYSKPSALEYELIFVGDNRAELVKKYYNEIDTVLSAMLYEQTNSSSIKDVIDISKGKEERILRMKMESRYGGEY